MTVLIVDDESFVREGLCKHIPWLSMGVNQILQADDGITALAEVEKHVPDIIISDIRMPRMNGIEFVSKIKFRYPNIKIIFMSAYSDKDYLKSAIQFKALGYIEKPIDLTEATKIIEDAVNQCIEELNIKRERLIAKSKIEEEQKKYYNETFLALLEGRISIDDAISFFKNISLEITVNTSFVVAIIVFKYDLLEDQCAIFEDNAKMCLNSAGFSVCFVHNIKDCLYLFIYRNELIQKEITNIDQKNIGKILLQSHSVPQDCFVVLGLPKTNIKDISDSFSSAIKSMGYLYINGYGKYFISSEIEEKNIDITTLLNHVELFKQNILNEDKIGCLKVLENIENIINKVDPISVKNILYDIVGKILFRAEQLNITFEKNKESIWGCIAQCKTANDTILLIQNLINDYFNKLLNQKQNFYVVDLVKRLVQKYYSDPNLSVNMLANKVGLSEAHLCVRFKKETGMTLLNYIRSVRMEMAKTLLSQPSLRIKDVMYQTGFRDQNYFTKTFKQFYSETPMEYRRKYFQ